MLTTKSTYLWAGAIATAVLKNPYITSEEARSALRSATDDIAPALREFDLHESKSADIGMEALRSFFKHLGNYTDAQVDNVLRKFFGEPKMRYAAWSGGASSKTL